MESANISLKARLDLLEKTFHDLDEEFPNDFDKVNALYRSFRGLARYMNTEEQFLTMMTCLSNKPIIRCDDCKNIAKGMTYCWNCSMVLCDACFEIRKTKGLGKCQKDSCVIKHK